MARQELQVELGVLITDANSDTGARLIQGAGAPGGDAGQQDAAELGSAYLDRTNGYVYSKDTAGTGADKWVRQSDNAYIATLLGVSENDVNAGTYTGTIISDSVSFKAGIQELEVDLDAVQTLTGVAAEAVDLGTFTGSVISDNVDIKVALQELETNAEATGAVVGTFSAVTTGTTVDTMLVDSFFAAEYFIYAQLDSDPTQRRAWKVICTHDGATGDATATDFNVIDIVKTDSFDVDTDIVLSGTGAAQTFGLEITAAAAVSGEFRREAL